MGWAFSCERVTPLEGNLAHVHNLRDPPDPEVARHEKGQLGLNGSAGAQSQMTSYLSKKILIT